MGAGLCFADVSTGEVHVTSIENENPKSDIINELGRYLPKEILLNPAAAVSPEIKEFIVKRMNSTAEMLDDERFNYNDCLKTVLNHFKKDSLEQFDFEFANSAVSALGVALQYLYETQKTDLENIREIDYYSGGALYAPRLSGKA